MSVQPVWSWSRRWEGIQQLLSQSGIQSTPSYLWALPAHSGQPGSPGMKLKLWHLKPQQAAERKSPPSPTGNWNGSRSIRFPSDVYLLRVCCVLDPMLSSRHIVIRLSRRRQTRHTHAHTHICTHREHTECKTMTRMLKMELQSFGILECSGMRAFTQ